MLSRHTGIIAASLFTALALTACGGGSDTLGSVAVSESTSRAAISHGAQTQSDANDTARHACGASDCKVILQFDNCGAFSVGSTSSGSAVYAAAAGSSKDAAQTAANSACNAKGSTNCAAVNDLPAQCN